VTQGWPEKSANPGLRCATLAG